MKETPSGVIQGQTQALGFSKAKLLSEIMANANAMKPLPTFSSRSLTFSGLCLSLSSMLT